LRETIDVHQRSRLGVTLMTTIWFGVGLLGQIVFGSRFVLQWLASERARRSIVPKHFWILSIVGSLFLLAYAIHRRDPIFILGQGAGLLIYARNMALLGGEGKLREGGN
jgi:lipid-A-disaccharide synthase-like uncharacterized protein